MKALGALLCAAAGYAYSRSAVLSTLAFAVGIVLVAMPAGTAKAKDEKKIQVLFESNQILEREVQSLQRVVQEKEKRIEELTIQLEALRKRLQEVISQAEEQGNVGVLVDELARGYEAVRHIMRGDDIEEATG